MTRYSLYYILMSDDQVDFLNSEQGGWDCDIGRAYLNAKMDGKYEKAIQLGMVCRAAELEANNPEEVWMTLQNGRKAWSDNSEIECLTDFPRSCDVGDLIVEEEVGDDQMNRVFRVASIGMEEFDKRIMRSL